MKVFANTDVGLVRQLNEDDYCIAHNANDEWMAIVCDGIGGAKAGEVASHTAVMTMYEAFMKSPVFKKDRQVDNWIRENLNQANDFIYSKSLKNPNERGMGTTAVGVIKVHIGTFIFNVGDSRICSTKSLIRQVRLNFIRGHLIFVLFAELLWMQF